jgi:uncharacterized membrane protein
MAEKKKPSSSSSSKLAVEQAAELVPSEVVETASLMIHSHSGPLPDPRTLEYYERIVPGAGREILDMAKAEQRHRHRLNWAGVGLSALGQIAAAAIGFFGVGGGLFLAYKGSAFTGLTAFIGTLATLAGVVLYNRAANQKRDASVQQSQEEPEN